MVMPHLNTRPNVGKNFGMFKEKNNFNKAYFYGIKNGSEMGHSWYETLDRVVVFSFVLKRSKNVLCFENT